MQCCKHGFPISYTVTDGRLSGLEKLRYLLELFYNESWKNEFVA